MIDTEGGLLTLGLQWRYHGDINNHDPALDKDTDIQVLTF